jgi:CHAT domain
MCDRMLANGEVGAALAHLDTLPIPDQADVPFLRIQMLHAAGLPIPALEAIKALVLPEDPDPEALVRLAHVCADAGADMDALAYLKAIAQESLAESSLLLASRIAERIGAFEIERDFESRIVAEYPSSPLVQRLCWRRAMVRGEFLTAAVTLPSDATHLREALFSLQYMLVDNDPPDFNAVRTVCEQHAGTPIPTIVVRFLLGKSHVEQALSVAIGLVEAPGDQEALALLAVFDALLLRRGSIDFTKHAQDVEKLVKGIISYLATRPERGILRHRLVKLLSVNRSGDLGLPIILTVALNLAKGSLALGPDILPDGASAQELETSGFLEAATRWLGARAPCVPGRTVLPRDLIPIEPDAVLGAIATIMSHSHLPLDSADDIELWKHWLLLGTAVAPLASKPDCVVSLFRTAATRLAIAHHPQQARDLCEEILIQSKNSPTQAQSAWFAMADIYSRLNDRYTCLVAFACAVAGRRGQEPMTGWNEINVWVRLLRDCKLYDYAIDALDSADDALRATGAYDRMRHHQDHLRLTIEHAKILSSPASNGSALPALVERACKSAFEALKRGEEATQSVVLLSQLIHLCETFSVTLPASARATLEELTGEHLSSKLFVQTLTDSDDPVAALWGLYCMDNEARYATDAASDAQHLIVPARDLLTRHLKKIDAQALILPFDLLADSGIAMPGWTERPRPPRRFTSNQEMLEVIAHLRARNVALVMAAFNNRGELLSLRCHDGGVAVVDEVGFNHASFQAWSKSYPFDYCNEPTATQAIFRKHELMIDTLEGCEWAPFPQHAVLMVFDTDLQSLPCNLIRTGFQFLGQTRAVGAAPSLAWLAESFRRPASSSRRLHAWISAAGDQGKTLNVLIANLKNTFAEQDVQLDTGDQPPASLAGADLVFVAAHGQVSPDGRYFHTLNDEGTLKIPAESLALALRNARVVVLFVCSGGRSDKVPSANTTSGLAKQLLDAGCATVIASPWPMEAMVAVEWAPTFLKHWKSGENVIEACFHANERISRDDPSRSLAMNLYGDPCQFCATSPT